MGHVECGVFFKGHGSHRDLHLSVRRQRQGGIRDRIDGWARDLAQAAMVGCRRGTGLIGCIGPAHLPGIGFVGPANPPGIGFIVAFSETTTDFIYLLTFWMVFFKD